MIKRKQVLENYKKTITKEYDNLVELAQKAKTEYKEAINKIKESEDNFDDVENAPHFRKKYLNPRYIFLFILIISFIIVTIYAFFNGILDNKYYVLIATCCFILLLLVIIYIIKKPRYISLTDDIYTD
jgi:hypothetical protein